tara:strand:- start:217 stop:1539 length:1323 start_codon:yes stop_codon:yes gene_type:complete
MNAIHHANVSYLGHKIGSAYYDEGSTTTAFQYDPEFLQYGLELSPVNLPLRAAPYAFKGLHPSFYTLPGMLADCLPDTYGNALINAWLKSQNRSANSMNPVEKLCYMGTRSMGALEFSPSIDSPSPQATELIFEELIELASDALHNKESLATQLANKEGLEKIISVGTSAGGARAKAVIAWNEKTNHVISGQSTIPAAYQHWILKFDGVDASFEGIKDPKGYGRIEYAYYLMAIDCGIQMMPSRLFEEGGRAHFMTKRFDRRDDGSKVHYASLYGMAHMPYTAPNDHVNDYEDYFALIDRIGIDATARPQAFARMCFNILSCNQDDHVKNFGFLMDEYGQWDLAPAFDIAYAHNSSPGAWTQQQQMSVNGKRHNIRYSDLIRCGRNANIGTEPQLRSIIEQVQASIDRFEAFAEYAGVNESQFDAIQYKLQSIRSDLYDS